jgi:cytochrome c553
MRLLLALAIVALLSPRAAQARDGRAIYAENCASCHGDDGRGESAREASLPIEPPDFTDCKFGTPEANTDWMATVHNGGYARGFDRRMPAFGELLSDDDIAAVVQYLRHFCTDDSWPRGELNLARPFFTEKAFPEDEAVVIMQGDRGSLTSTLVYEKRFYARWQFELAVPAAYVEQMTGGWHGGIGDIAVGMKRVLFSNLATGSIASAMLEVSIPNGRFDRELGAGTSMTEGSVLAAQLIGPMFLQLHAGAAIAYDRSFPDEVFARIALGQQITPVRFGRMFSPMVEVTLTRELESDAPTDVDLVPELQVTLSTRQHIRAAVGVAVPVTDRSRDVSGLVYFLWDIADGGLTEGW